MRKRLYEIISAAEVGDAASRAYDITMMIVIVASLVPLATKVQTKALALIDQVAVVAFIIDYLMRWFTADYHLRRGAVSWFFYPVTPMAIVDILCILPSFRVIGGGFRVLKILRLFRCFRVFKFLRYSKSLQIIIAVLKKQSKALGAVLTLALAYVFVCALVIFNVEPETFETYFDAVYWAMVSLTTMGYGDIYPTSDFGRMVTMVSSVFGIAIVALPAGIITAGYMDEIGKADKEDT